MRYSITPAIFVAIVLAGCAGTTTSAPEPSPPRSAASSPALPEETHLADLRQLTFGGENAEAYWSFDGTQLSFQARREGQGCDRIYRMSVVEDPPKPVLVSSGKGATTCAHFLPGDEELIYASTHLGGDACPPKPDHSKGYVWALYDTYDIFRARAADGSGLVQLTEEKGYDAEGTVCGKDGSILFTSVRDGDLELYRMDADGKNVKRLTHTPGYDGGAFWNSDCTKIVWRASRPRPGKELEEYQALLAQGLVRPSKLELYVSDADGNDARQITYLGAAAFAPFFHPTQDRVLFSTNYPDPRGREFDIWAVNTDGTNLERITYAPGFDGFPMFSPDGKWLAFSSNRATAPGRTDTNVFVARWVDAPAKPAVESGADRVMRDIEWLAAPERAGRGLGSAGLAEAGEWIAEQLATLGVAPAGDDGSFRQRFPVTVGVEAAPASSLTVGGAPVAKDAWTPLGFSASGTVAAPMVLAGYGIEDDAAKRHDYAGVNAKGKIVVVRRFVPDTPELEETAKQRRLGDLRYKAWLAREKGAKALIVVDWPEAAKPAPKGWKLPAEAPLPALEPDGPGDAGIPVIVVKRAALAAAWPELEAKKSVQAKLQVELSSTKEEAFNVVGRIPAAGAVGDGPRGTVVIGAHYDHLGMGGRNSLAPDKHAPHLGADDNASGTAALLEIARILAARRGELRRDVLIVAFSGEESGALGSTHFTRAASESAMKDFVAMINLDMVGRMRNNQLAALGTDSAKEWMGLIDPACDRARVECKGGGDGFGASDQTPFYAAGVPVVHFFTGTHGDYHKPSDTPARINAAGAAQVARIAADVAAQLATSEQRLTYEKVPAPTPRGDMRSFNASLGTIPDYAGPPRGAKGVLLAGVRPGGAADLAGMRRGDVLVRLGRWEVGSVEDLMYALNAAKPGETVTAVVLREGEEVALEVTFQESRRPR